MIVATNAYADGVVPDLAKRVLPINSYIIATVRWSDGSVSSSARR